MRDRFDWREIHEFWLPPTLANADYEGLKKMLGWWMAGGATPEVQRFRPVVEAARAGRLEDWRATPAGRLSLIVVLDQFSTRPVCRDGRGLQFRSCGAPRRGGRYSRRSLRCTLRKRAFS
jgi:uncharacterized protein (DUF924 family)